MLIFGKKLTAREACAQGFVTEVFPDSTLQKEVWTRLKAYSELPPNVSILFVFFICRNRNILSALGRKTI